MPSPALAAVSDDYQTIRFNGTVLENDSYYKGVPSPELDARWKSLYDHGAFSISHETLLNIGASEDSVKLPPESGGGYMAGLEVFHQIHCVRFLWQNTHPTYYQTIESGAANQSSTYRQHLDHCADILRQKLMCDADVGVITYNWLKHYSHPVPNFNALHKCRNFDAVVAWNTENQAPVPHGGKVVKGPDAVVWDSPP